uniref:Uncharacterized protein n=1 Tax=Oryza glumipatula TaxID=40148 RepID=A0A0D9ZZD7_9ORYZ
MASGSNSSCWCGRLVAPARLNPCLCEVSSSLQRATIIYPRAMSMEDNAYHFSRVESDTSVGNGMRALCPGSTRLRRCGQVLPHPIETHAFYWAMAGGPRVQLGMVNPIHRVVAWIK